MWPELVQDGHLAELRALISPELRLDVEAVESEPAPEQKITLAHVEALAQDPNIALAAGRLAQRGAQAVAYGCTSASYVLGPTGDAAIIQNMRNAAGVPSTTTTTAVVVALRTLGARSVAVLSPHIDDLNERLRAYLEASGFAVTTMVGLNLSCDIEAVEPTETQDIVESQVDRSDADAVFISCTAMRTAAIIDDLELSLGKPVVTANQATLTHLRRLAASHRRNSATVFVPDPVR